MSKDNRVMADRQAKLVIYGCGATGKNMLPFVQEKGYQVVAYLDKSAKEGETYSYYQEIPVFPPEHIQKLEFDFVLIATTKSNFAEEIRESLKILNIQQEKIMEIDDISTKYVICGCGRRAAEILSWLQNDWICRPVVAYIQNRAESGEKDAGWLGIPVYAFEKIQSIDYDYILLAMSHEDGLKTKRALMELAVPSDKIVDMSLFGYRDSRYSFTQGFADYIHWEGIDGAVAECGVDLGINAKWINLFFPDRELYLFDTFEGFSESDLIVERSIGDKAFLEGDYNKVCFYDDDPDSKIQLVREKMTYPEKVIFRKGYFPDTAAGIDSTFCFVNLDMDLYMPILNGLRFFWDKMAAGGGIMIHDYFQPELPGVKKAVLDFETEINMKLAKTPIGDNCSIFIIKQ